ncbi:GHMP kinase [Tamlana fucoidanivorans]|uniref:GHMP kinase n=1 Tax=Allotamlana fucoidanivorans TaxID=2583814 RepID=A0A5C4SMJ3_9FLAO|nr:GYDIA family GHMP kinase [Tamlana fucoidanivorans]TNJ44731.1 GHMP kinase [Tamlana fucoidanivorans]
MKNKTFYSHGKLLISGEYVILDGALSLALPTKKGQSLTIEPLDNNSILWESYDENETLWYKGEFKIHNNLKITSKSEDDTSKRLIQIFHTIADLNPNVFKNQKGFKAITKLEFPTNWGLGTSSTLINNLAQYACVNPYKLLEMTFGGSGYDIACAQNDTSITYKLNGKTPVIVPVDFNPDFKNHLFFVHLNKKQNSREGIKHYKAYRSHIEPKLKEISLLTQQILDSKTLTHFEALIEKHETIIAEVTKQTSVKTLFFSDFPGSIKSLGAWGGDFILAASKENPTSYFKQKGFHTIIAYQDMIL